MEPRSHFILSITLQPKLFSLSTKCEVFFFFLVWFTSLNFTITVLRWQIAILCYMLFLFWWGVRVDEITSFCLDIFPVWSPSWSRSTLQERPSWPRQSSPSAQVKLQAVSPSDSSSCHFLFSFRQTWVRFLKRGCGCGITSRRREWGPGIRAADRRTLQTRRMEPQTWRARRSASASAPPRRPASSSMSAPSPPTSWRR